VCGIIGAAASRLMLPVGNIANISIALTGLSGASGASYPKYAAMNGAIGGSLPHDL
jgi:hypothetical protein